MLGLCSHGMHPADPACPRRSGPALAGVGSGVVPQPRTVQTATTAQAARLLGAGALDRRTASHAAGQCRGGEPLAGEALGGLRPCQQRRDLPRCALGCGDPGRSPGQGSRAPPRGSVDDLPPAA